MGLKMDTNKNEKLHKEIEELLLQKPSEASRILSTISNSLKYYENAVKDLKDKQAAYALYQLLMLHGETQNKIPADAFVPAAIDGYFYIIGNDSNPWRTGHAPAMIKSINMFCEKLIEYSIEKHSYWLNVIKGPEYFNFVVRLLESYQNYRANLTND